MSSVYKLMNWLTIEQAVSYFNGMVSQAITPQELLQISESGCIDTYINTDRVSCNDIEFSPFLGSLSGYHKLHNPGLFVNQISGMGFWEVTAEGQVGDEIEVWTGLFPLSSSGGFWFKTEDVCDLFRSIEGSAKDKSQSVAGVNDEDLKALEALGLLVETMAKQSNKYRIGDTGRPNFAQIATAMSQQAGDVYGMKPRTLQDRLSTALAAWQERCK